MKEAYQIGAPPENRPNFSQTDLGPFPSHLYIVVWVPRVNRRGNTLARYRMEGLAMIVRTSNDEETHNMGACQGRASYIHVVAYKI